MAHAAEGDGITEEKRARRHDLMRKLQVHDAESNAILGEVINISLSGVRMLSREEYKPGSQIAVRLAWNKRDVWASLNVELDVAWCKPSGQALAYESGMRFVGLDPEKRACVESLINDMGYSF